MSKFATLDEIKHAHNVLLKDQPFFEQDKIDIIECNETKDIKACPGSGKTTTLLAKLIILANQMPLENNQGICVLTHTNVAIDEIKSKLGNKADILFKYPNHFGTIQSFVDKFLAIPALKEFYSTNVRRIDNDLANKVLLSEFYKLDPYRSKLHTLLYTRFYNTLNEILNEEIDIWVAKLHQPTLKKFLLDNGIIKPKGKKFQLDMTNSKWSVLITKTNNQNIRSVIYKRRKSIDNDIEIRKREFILKLNIDFVAKKVYEDNLVISSESDSGIIFTNIKEECYKKGILSYQDAYCLGFKYIDIHINSLQKAFSSRFKYLFIDEMQDTEKKQLDIVDKIFDKEKTIVQCFGDHHQAIYNKVSDEELWKPVNPLEINGSKRFGENITKILRTVCIEDNKDLKPNDKISSLNPILIVFDNPLDVLPKFSELLNTKKIDEKTVWKFAEDEKRKDPKSRINIKAIGWVGKPNNEFNIKSYFSEFNGIAKKEKVNYNSLKSFLKKQNKANIKEYSNKIIEALLHILSIANVKYLVGKTSRTYTKTTLLEEFAKRDEEKANNLRSNLVRWAKDIHNSDAFNNETIAQIRSYIRILFCPMFGVDVANQYVNSFIDSNESTDISEDEIKKNNQFKKDGVEIEVGTIHSVKGETHVATLYLETSYYGKHESQRILEQMKGVAYKARKSDTHIKEALKMAYVGMSRPKYMLCFAIHRSRYDDALDIENGGMWEVAEIFKINI